MATAFKGVTLDHKSPGMQRDRSHGYLDFTDDEWAQLQLGYLLGATVTPDPDVELAVKSGNPGYQAHAAVSAGIHAYTDRPGQDISPLAATRGQYEQAVTLAYDPADVISEQVAPGYQCSRVRLRSAQVVAYPIPQTGPSGAALTVAAVFFAAASGAVAYTVEDADAATVQSGTATHDSGGGYHFTLAAQPAGLYDVHWVGTWGGASQTFVTRVSLRTPT